MMKKMMATGLGLAAVLVLTMPGRLAAQVATDESSKAVSGDRFGDSDPSGAVKGADSAVDARGSGDEMAQLLKKNEALRLRKAEKIRNLKAENDKLTLEIDGTAKTAPAAAKPAPKAEQSTLEKLIGAPAGSSTQEKTKIVAANVGAATVTAVVGLVCILGAMAFVVNIATHLI